MTTRSYRSLRRQLGRSIATDRKAIAAGLGSSGLMFLLLSLLQAKGDFGLLQVLIVAGIVQMTGALHFALALPSAPRHRGAGRSGAELTALTEERDEAVAADRAKSRLLAAMSHEIRTPTSGIIGMSGLLLGTQITDEQTTYVKAIQRSSRDLLGLIDEILDFSKIEAGHLTLNVSPFALDECIEGVVELLAPRAHQKSIELAWLIEPGVPLQVSGDLMRIRQILLNLVGNAIKFTDRGGVLVRIRSSGREGALNDRRVPVSIIVEDTGGGIDEADLPRLFSDFARVGTSGKEGTGLGLAISRRLAQAMGGDISITSEPGRGSAVRLDFTLLEQPGAEVWGARALPERSGQPGRVLLALDRALEREAASASLAAVGMHCVQAGFASAIDQFVREGRSGPPIEVVVVDAEADPREAGLLLSRLRRLAHPAEVVGVVMIDSRTRGSLERFREHGLAHWLVRPLRPASLAKLVRRLLREGSSEESRPSARALISANIERRSLKVLLAEDDDVNALLGSIVLQNAGCLPSIVRGGRGAVEEVRRCLVGEETGFDLILLDIVMPDISGIETARLIREAYGALSRPVPPIVAITAHAPIESRERLLADGFDDYLAKPLEPAMLEDLIGRWSDRSRISTAA